MLVRCRGKEVGCRLDALEHIMISLLNAQLPHREALFIWPTTAVRHSKQTAEGLQTCKQTPIAAAAGPGEHAAPFLFLAL